MVCSRCPRECRLYETVLKRKCFKKLKNNVWETKTKWILIKKADNHLRNKLLYKYINLWMSYLYDRYKKKINRRAISAHFEEKLKVKVFLALKRNVEQNRMLLRISKRKFEFGLKYSCWHQWKHYVQKRLKVREVKVLADRIREERLRIRFFYMWLFRFSEKQLLKDGYNLAIVKHETKLKEKCFKYWKIFTKKQICKRNIEKLAITCYKDKLKERFIRCWRNYISQKKQYEYRVSVVQNFYENYLVKNYLSRWWIIYKNFEHKNEIYKSNLAVNFHKRKLLKDSFTTLWRFRTVRKAREEKVKKFHNIYISIYLDVWVERTTEKTVWNGYETKAAEWRDDYLRELLLTKLFDMYQERTEKKKEIENVIKYYNAIIIHRAFRGWREVVDNKTQKKTQLENAGKIYAEKLTKKSFENWKKHTLKRTRKKMAVDYYRLTLLLRIMSQWRMFFKKRKLKLAKVEILEQKNNTKLLKTTFDCWKNETEVSKSKLNAAVYFYNRLKLSKAFYIWRKNIRIKTVNKTHFTRNKNILNDIIIKDTIYRWYKMLSVSEDIKKKLMEFKSRQEKRFLSSCFSSWHRFVEKMKWLQQNIDGYMELKSSFLIEQYLVILLEAVKRKKIFNQKEELAVKIEEKLLKRRYLRKWFSFITWKRKKIQSCVSEERKFNPEDVCEFFIPAKKSTRRQPMIPGYLRADFANDQFQEEDIINQKTYRVERPVNKNVPLIVQKESFISFEV